MEGGPKRTGVTSGPSRSGRDASSSFLASLGPLVLPEMGVDDRDGESGAQEDHRGDLGDHGERDRRSETAQ